MKEEEILKKAREMAKRDKNIAIWLDIWENGIRTKLVKKVRKRGRKKIFEYMYDEIPIYSDFALRNLEKAIRLREEGKVFVRR